MREYIGIKNIYQNSQHKQFIGIIAMGINTNISYTFFYIFFLF